MRHIATCLVVVLLAGCDGYRGIKGRVLDPGDKPVADASVRLLQLGDARSRTSECKTDKEGRYGVGLVGSPMGNQRFSLTISKYGFKTHSETIDLSNGPQRETNIVLDRDDKE
jgi:carboxypeptidase family protein